MNDKQHDTASSAPVERRVIHIHAPKATAKRVLKMTCADCKKRTRVIEFFTQWYGWHSTCLKCGREWADGQWLPLEFARGVRCRQLVRTILALTYNVKLPSPPGERRQTERKQ